ncbi:MAG TPA: DUF4142 domain-containing protein [Thermoanaerobaculia bacterium]|nr:DUF4142 domain-containing protein [Thermoanaerobaculia bacterium]
MDRLELMKSLTKAVMSLLLLSGCHRAPVIAAQTDPNAVIASLIRITSSDADLAAMASRRGQSAETRAVAARIEVESAAMNAELTALARRHNVPLPQQEEKRVAMKEDLSILRPELFDQAYALAMVQETRDLVQTINTASRKNDTLVRQFAQSHQGMIAEEQRRANSLLGHTGGAPWPGFTP